jgi:hypothetical protein
MSFAPKGQKRHQCLTRPSFSTFSIAKGKYPEGVLECAAVRAALRCRLPIGHSRLEPHPDGAWLAPIVWCACLRPVVFWFLLRLTDVAVRLCLCWLSVSPLCSQKRSRDGSPQPRAASKGEHMANFHKMYREVIELGACVKVKGLMAQALCVCVWGGDWRVCSTNSWALIAHCRCFAIHG